MAAGLLRPAPVSARMFPSRALRVESVARRAGCLHCLLSAVLPEIAHQVGVKWICTMPALFTYLCNLLRRRYAFGRSVGAPEFQYARPLHTMLHAKPVDLGIAGADDVSFLLRSWATE